MFRSFLQISRLSCPSRQLVWSRPQRKAVTRSRKARVPKGMLIQRASFLVRAKTIVSSGTLPICQRSRNSTRAWPSPSSACASASGERLRIGQFGIIGKVFAQLRLLLGELRLDLRDGGARRFGGLGVRLACRRIEAAISGLAGADQILLLAHELGQFLAAFGKAGGHGGERIGGLVLQRPLRKLEALGTVCGIAGIGTVKRPRIGPQVACILRKNRLCQGRRAPVRCAP